MHALPLIPLSLGPQLGGLLLNSSGSAIPSGSPRLENVDGCSVHCDVHFHAWCLGTCNCYGYYFILGTFIPELSITCANMVELFQ